MRLESSMGSDAVDHVAAEHVLWTLFLGVDQLALKGFSPPVSMHAGFEVYKGLALAMVAGLSQRNFVWCSVTFNMF